METEWASYNSSYEVKSEGKLVIRRKFVQKKSLVPLEGYPEFKELVNKMKKDQQSSLQIKG